MVNYLTMILAEIIVEIELFICYLNTYITRRLSVIIVKFLIKNHNYL